MMFDKMVKVLAKNGVGSKQHVEAQEAISAQLLFIRFTVKHPGKIPEGFPGAGNPAWMFLDEIEVH